jgi:putative aldouronate transport system substrate-binding protein
MRKLISFMLVFVLTFMVILTGCGQTQTNNQASTSTQTGSSEASAEPAADASAPGKFPLVQEKTTIKVLISWDQTYPIEKNWNTEDYEKKTNVHVEWQTVPQDGWLEKRALVFASGDLPDVVVSGADTLNFKPSDEMKYGSQGLILPLNNLIDKDSIYLKKIFADNPLYKSIATSPDGNIYTLPDFNVCYHCDYSQKMWINTAWLKKLNLQMPTTTDEFEQVLKAFKDNDPNGNGKADEKPLTAAIDGWHWYLDGFLMNAFTYTDDETRMHMENGKIIFEPTLDAYKEGLQYLNKLYKEKLIDPASFTQSWTAAEKLNEAGDAEVIGAIPAGASFMFAGNYTVSPRWKNYEPVLPLAGPGGFKTATNYTLRRDVTTGFFAITKAAKDPDMIMKWVDWMYSDEGTIWHDEAGGREDVDWRKSDGTETDFNGNPAQYVRLTLAADDTYYKNTVWGQKFPSFRSKAFRESWAVPKQWNMDDPMGGEVQLFQATKEYEKVAAPIDYCLPPIVVDTDKISEYNRLQTAINDYLKEATTKFIIGNMNLDTDWDKFKTQLDNIGLQKYMQMTQEAYDFKYKK